ncbi:unnamed protein product [Phytophthora fragariaefolia]|uniref:Unnamed protein product n=1 Tax=Phytophthora fragariaefolia TaxID=1490495 RepID=A0A9W6Y7Q3_9STRA|nr:unnamed protein product [Phytophthora fragariaefolia]
MNGGHTAMWPTRMHPLVHVARLWRLAESVAPLQSAATGEVVFKDDGTANTGTGSRLGLVPSLTRGSEVGAGLALGKGAFGDADEEVLTGATPTQSQPWLLANVISPAYRLVST